MQSRAGALTNGIQTLDTRAGVQVNLDAATHVMGRGHHGDILLSDIDAQIQAVLIDVGEVMLGLLGILVGHVEIDVVLTALLHLVVDGAGHNVARRERQARVILLHEFLASQVAQHATVAAHGLGDEESGAITRMIQGSGMELDELHVLNRALGAIDHSDTVARCHQRVGRRVINQADAARRHERHTRQEGIDLACLLIEDVSPIALDARRAARHDFAQVVLREDFHGKVVLKHVDIGIGLDRLDERYLDLMARIVGMMQDAELAVTALAVQVKLAFLVPVKIHAPTQQFLNLAGRLGNHFLHRLGVVEPVTSNHRVMDVLIKVIHLQVSHGGDTALGQVGIGLFHFGLAHECHSPRFCHLEGKTHTSHTRADDEIIIFAYHI